MITRGAQLTGKFNIDKLMLIRPNPAFDSQIRYSYRGNIPNMNPHRYFFTENEDGTINIPRNFPLGRDFLPGKWEEAIQDKTDKGRFLNITFTGTLRDYQIPFLEQIEGDDVILNMPCGTGKTASAIYLMSKLKVSTIILCPSKFLTEQWDESIEKFSPLTKWNNRIEKETGVKPFILTKSSTDFSKEGIVIMSYAMASKLDAKRFKGFGCLICDEVHRAGSRTYEPILAKIPAKYRIGLTATFRREDKLEEILKYHFGKMYTLVNPFQKAKLYYVFTQYSTNKSMIKGYAGLDTMVANSEIRNNIVHHIIEECLKAGRKPLVLSKRVEALKTMAAKYPNSGLVISESKETPASIKTKNPVFGIMQLAREGLDIDDVDTLILHLPTKDLEQPIGRILRIKEGKKTPLVLILTDNIPSYKKVLIKACDFAGHSSYEGNIDYKQINTIL